MTTTTTTTDNHEDAAAHGNLAGQIAWSNECRFPGGAEAYARSQAIRLAYDDVEGYVAGFLVGYDGWGGA